MSSIQIGWDFATTGQGESHWPYIIGKDKKWHYMNWFKGVDSSGKAIDPKTLGQGQPNVGASVDKATVTSWIAEKQAWIASRPIAVQVVIGVPGTPPPGGGMV